MEITILMFLPFLMIPFLILVGIFVSKQPELLMGETRSLDRGLKFNLPGFGHSAVLLHRQLQVSLRKPQSYWIFSMALVGISASFAVAYNSLTGVTYNLDSLSRVTPQLINFYRILSSIGIVLFVPVIGVSSIMQERESGTLDLILTTSTHPIEFVLSKIGAALIVVLVILLGMAPVMSVTFCMGGVSPFDIISVLFFQIAITVFALSVSITIGSFLPRFFVALIVSYVVVSVFSLIFYVSGQFGTPRENIILPGAIAFMGVSIALSFLSMIPRFLAMEINQVKPKWWRPISLKGFDAQLWTFLGAREYGDPISDRANPIYVAERDRFFNAVVRRDWDAPSMLFLASVLFSIAALFPNLMLQVEYAVILIFTPMVGASLFSSEHERANWENLRSTLLKTPSIFWGKMRLAFGNGLIHAYAFYVPALMILGIIWLTSIVVYPQGIAYIKPDFLFRVWAGHALVFIAIGFTVLFLSALSTMISTLHKRTMPALLQSYGLSAFFLFGPWYFKLLHPNPSYHLGGKGGMDWFSIILTVWNGPFVFNLWPSVSDRNTEAYDTIFWFWKMYSSHILLLIVLTMICTTIAYKQIHTEHE